MMFFIATSSPYILLTLLLQHRRMLYSREIGLGLPRNLNFNSRDAMRGGSRRTSQAAGATAEALIGVCSLTRG